MLFVCSVLSIWKSEGLKHTKTFFKRLEAFAGLPYLEAVIRNTILASLALTLLSCGGSKVLKQIEAEPAYQQAFTGFFLADALSGEVLEEVNADLLFTPASNTKLLTFATCLNWLPQDSIPALAYAYEADTLRLWGLAYPQLAADDLPYNERIRKIIADWPGTVEVNLHGYVRLPRFGEGWMWDDFNYAFARERSGMPLYRNMARVNRLPDTVLALQEGTPTTLIRFKTQPSFIVAQPSGYVREKYLNRSEFSNRFAASAKTSQTDTLSAPLFSAANLITQLLEDWTGRPIRYHNKPLPKDWGTRVWNGEPRDSLLRQMMLPSDNFMAEQLLLESGLYSKDLTDVGQVLAKAQKEVLQISEDDLFWADGSGVSHYNLVTPRALGLLVHRLSAKQGVDYLTHFLPAGGESGTIKDWYSGRGGVPYVYAKTGTLRHNHSLTGLLKTKSGRWLAFSFMHNHYRGGSKTYKEAMEETLALIRDSY
jgi:D-alanyl-D-alanine carboxypeptidase/D-alanyl-D-alanine-endopeptidase (penicillin-binding protein 4)